MSHFSLTVRVSRERLAAAQGDLDKAIAEMMAPYDENTEDPRFRKFDDEQKDAEETYATHTATRYRASDGSLHDPYEEFYDRLMGKLLPPPPGYEEVEVPLKEIFPSLDAWAKDYGLTQHSDTRHWGAYRNPEKKWDYWCIGGRWAGFYPIVPGAMARLGKDPDRTAEAQTSDIVLPGEIDMARVVAKRDERARTFFARYHELLGGAKFDDPFEGPRHQALDLGLIEVMKGPCSADEGHYCIPWSTYEGVTDNERQQWTDRCRIIRSVDDFLAEFIEAFTTIATYAYLDDDGWHAPGRVGWWGASSDTPPDYLAYKRGFVKNVIEAAKPTDLLVCVDCHI